MKKDKSEMDAAEAARVAALEDAFLVPSGEVGGLRAFSIGTFRLASKMGLTMFTGEVKDLTPDEQMRQLISLAWAQSAPLMEVLQAVNLGRWEAAVDLWQFTLPTSELPKLVAEIRRLGEQAAAASVEVEEQPVEGGASRKKPRGKS
jgi:hypothetical protein